MTTHKLIAAPTPLQPGGYIKVAYAARNEPLIPSADLNLEQVGDGYRITLRWKCPNPVSDASTDTNLWVDAAAVLAPGVPGAPWITMGAEQLPVQGALWRADRKEVTRIHAEGLGSVERQAAPKGWQVSAEWNKGQWRVTFELQSWPALAQHGQIALAVWRGEAQDRGGLKSISQGWIEL